MIDCGPVLSRLAGSSSTYDNYCRVSTSLANKRHMVTRPGLALTAYVPVRENSEWMHLKRSVQRESVMMCTSHPIGACLRRYLNAVLLLAKPSDRSQGCFEASGTVKWGTLPRCGVRIVR
jgi:hypothetical protein